MPDDFYEDGHWEDDRADEREEARRLRWEEDHPEPNLEACALCRENRWVLRETTVYGDDADGRRGVPLAIYECDCGNEVEV